MLLKNKKYDILQENNIEISYVDKDDFLLIQGPFRLLNDVTIKYIYPQNPVFAKD